MKSYSMFKPWKGPQYESTGLLLLGESAYSWKEHGRTKHPSVEHCRNLVKWVVSDFEACTHKGRFMATLSRALTNEVCPSKKRLRFVWDRVAFTNYVPGTVGDGARIRPDKHKWASAKRGFPQLLKKLRPRCVIVIGKGMWNKMPDPDLYISKDVQGYRLDTGDLAMCWAVRHPAGGLKWQDLAAVIHFTYQRELEG